MIVKKEEERKRRMAEEGQVIGVHTVNEWNEHLKKGEESKKLVIFYS